MVEGVNCKQQVRVAGCRSEFVVMTQGHSGHVTLLKGQNKKVH